MPQGRLHFRTSCDSMDHLLRDGRPCEPRRPVSTDTSRNEPHGAPHGAARMCASVSADPHRTAFTGRGAEDKMFRATLSLALLASLIVPAAAEQANPSLTGEWGIAAIATATGALVDLDGGLTSSTEVRVDRHGLWMASAGCNRLRGTLEQNGRALDVSSDVMSTHMDCKGLNGDLERRFMRYFPAAVQVDGMPGRVMLRDGTGAAVVVLVGK